MKVSAAAVALAFALVLANFADQSHGALQEGFYEGKCNVDVEKIVSNIITPLVGQEPWITPALLRMQFHDCFVNVNSFYLLSVAILLINLIKRRPASPRANILCFL